MCLPLRAVVSGFGFFTSVVPLKTNKKTICAEKLKLFFNVSSGVSSFFLIFFNCHFMK